MSNPFYNHTSGVPAAQTRGISSSIRAEYDLVQTGFDLVQAALALKGNVTGQAWTGTHSFSGTVTYSGAVDFTTGSITVPTQAPGDSSTKAASTAFVSAAAFSAALPAQSGNAGKFVTTDGSTASWGVVYTAGSDIYLATNYSAL